MAVRIILIFIFAVLVIAVTMFIYLAVYKKRIARRLEMAELDPYAQRPRPMMPPILVFIVTFIGVTVAAYLIMAVLGVVIYSFKTDSGTVEHEPQIYEQTMDREYLENSPLAGYSPGDEIPGYVKYEKTDGEIHFIYYVYNDCWSEMFPQLLICPEYMGTKKPAASGEQVEIKSSDSTTSFGSFGETPGEMMFHGITTRFCEGNFSYTYFVTETEPAQDETYDQSELRKDALASGTLTIDLDHLEELTYSYWADKE